MNASRLRIAFVVHDYNRHGGHSRYVVELARRYRQEHDVHVFTNTIDDPETEKITFHHVPAWRPNALASILSFIIPGTFAVRGPFDVVHAQGLCGLRHNLATAHFCQAAWYAALDAQQQPLTWKQHTTRRLVTGLEQRALCQTETQRVIAVSNLVRTNLANYYGRESGVDVIYHGTDTDRFQPGNREKFRTAIRASLGIHDDRFLALYVGDLKKGAVAAVRAIAQAPGTTLLIVSGSDPSVVQRVGTELGVMDRIIIHPHTKQIEAFFAAADAFVFPTVYDPFGLVITEAMASGLAVVTSAAAGAAELITSGQDGFVTEQAWDAEAIAQHLMVLRDDVSLRERVGIAACQRVQALTWDRTAAETLSVYQAMLAS
ncbi:glycosyltransferase [bacterium]|nr:glycosyltransferase [bacterium]